MQDRPEERLLCSSRIKAQCKSNHLPRGHALDNVFIGRFVDGKGYTDIIPSTLSFLIKLKKSYVEPTSTLEFQHGDSRL